MRFFRSLLICVTLVLVLAGLTLGFLFTPPVQTWLFERWLTKHGVQGSVDSVSAGFSAIHLTNFRVQRGGATLTIQQLDAQLPMKPAVWEHRYSIRSIDAKGCTLDFTAAKPDPGAQRTHRAQLSGLSASSIGSQLNPAAQLGALLAGWKLPVDTSVERIDAVGDVLVANPKSGDPIATRVTLTGTGLAPARTCDLKLDATTDVSQTPLPFQIITGRGQFTVLTLASGRLGGISFDGVIAADAGAPAVGIAFAVTPAADGANTKYEVSFNHDHRAMVALTATTSADSPRILGAWNVDLRDSDLAQYFGNRRWFVDTLSGRGTFDCTAPFEGVHLTGELTSPAVHALELAFGLSPTAQLGAQMQFDVRQRGSLLAIDRLSLSMAGPNDPTFTAPVFKADARQPFTIDERTREVRPANVDEDLIRFTLHALSLARFPGTAAIKEGVASGEFVARVASDGGIVLRSTRPAVVTHVRFQPAGAPSTPELALSLTLIATHTPNTGWQFRAAPLTANDGERQLATLNATISPLIDPSRLFAIKGTITADLGAWVHTSPVIARIAKSVTADFSANFGPATDLTANVTLNASDPARTIRATVGVAIDDYRSASFHVPLKLGHGRDVSDVLIDGTWTKDAEADRLDIQVSSPKVSLDQLKSTFRPLSELPEPAPSGAEAGRTRHPWWGTTTGRVRFDFNEVDSGALRFDDVGGTFDLSPTAVRLNGGTAVFFPINMSRVERVRELDARQEPRTALFAEGTISFDSTAAIPYRLKAKAGADPVDAARLFGKPPEGSDPVFEGLWSITDNLTGSGVTLPELIKGRKESFVLTSKEGVIRVLKTNVGAALPDAPTPVSDAAANVGSTVGWLFGVHRGAAMNRVSKQMQAVLDFSYDVAEIRYEHLAVTATRAADGAIRLTDISIMAPHEHLTGSGEIAAGQGEPFRSRPLHLDLQLGVRGISADRLATARLLLPDKDTLGYSRIREPIYLGGTLERIDAAAWRELLAKAAEGP